jgi:pyrroline-5-carboxylate reductase
MGMSNFFTRDNFPESGATANSKIDVFSRHLTELKSRKVHAGQSLCPIQLTFANGFITYQTANSGGSINDQGEHVMLKGKKIGFIGGGNMAEALIKGLLAGGVPARDIAVAEPAAERRGFLQERYSVAVGNENSAIAAACDLIILSVKPQVCSEALDSVRQALTPDKPLISILAGITTAALESALAGKPRVVRVMPNTPSLVMEGAAAICAGANATGEDISVARHIFELVGKTWLVEEKLLDTVTGLSGSGPAYVLTFIEALSDAGVKNGLSRDIATGLAAQTVFGTAKLLLETREHPAVLRDKVTSPGGTTIAGMYALEKDRFRGAVINGVDAAIARSRELGKN